MEGYKRGAEEFEKVIGMGCDTAYARYEFGRALSGDGQHKRAAEQLRIATAMDPTDWATHWFLARTLIIDLDEFEDGLNELSIARKIDDLDDLGHSYDYYFGRAYEGKDEFNKAINHYRRFEKRQSRINKNDEQLIDVRKRIAKLETELEQGSR